MPKPGERVRHVLRAPAAQALDLKLVTKADLVRLKVIARVHARGLPPDVSWTDLLQEAFARVLDGSRRHPDGLPIVAFLAGIMRSIKAEHWRRFRRQSAELPAMLAHADCGNSQDIEHCDPAPDPEQALIARQELAAIEQLFADDAQARLVIAGLFEGLSLEEICTQSNMSRTDYESTRKRMRRVLTRESLRMSQP